MHAPRCAALHGRRRASRAHDATASRARAHRRRREAGLSAAADGMMDAWPQGFRGRWVGGWVGAARCLFVVRALRARGIYRRAYEISSVSCPTLTPP